MAQLKRRLGWAATVAAVILILGSVAAAFFLGQSWETEPRSSSSPTITEIQRLGELVVLRVSVADVLEKSSDDFRGVWIVRGDALVAVDMRLAELQSIDEESKELVVLLPQPTAIQPRVDHEKSTTYDVSKTRWWDPTVGGSEEFIDEGLDEAQGVVESASSGEEVMDQARDQAELVLDNMYRLVGWDIKVVWQE